MENYEHWSTVAEVIVKISGLLVKTRGTSHFTRLFSGLPGLPGLFRDHGLFTRTSRSGDFKF